MLAQKDRFIRGFAKKMLTYALGRSVGQPTARPSTQSGNSSNGTNVESNRCLQAVVASEAFLKK
ncbi:MAG TPA: DUF1585 domain-containing protein [Pirellulales bacterium]|nr:DUF1585 domain-containing protein [Pirellulales bacterium]